MDTSFKLAGTEKKHQLLRVETLWLVKAPVLLQGAPKSYRFNRWGVFATGSYMRSNSEYIIRCLAKKSQHG